MKPSSNSRRMFYSNNKLNHFGYSREDDAFVSNPDMIQIKPGEIKETYTYEKDDNVIALGNVIRNMIKVSIRLQTETNEKVIARIHEIIKNAKQCIYVNRDIVHRVLLTQEEMREYNKIMGQNTL